MTTNTLKHNALIIDNDAALPFLFDKSVAGSMPIEKSVKEKTTFRTAATTKGSVDSTASKQWMSRPDEDKYLDLTSMREAIHNRYTNSRVIDINSKNFPLNAKMQLVPNDSDKPLNLTNWTYNQLCSLSGAPVEYLKKLSPDLASDCIRWGLYNKGAETVKALVNVKDNTLRAVNSATYGRIWDYQVIDEVMRIAGNGVDDTCWKVPGQIDWASSNGTTVEYNPYVDVTKETTTLYASDRDVFIFLVDDTHPIEIGKLANGEPDLMFRGFYVSNSETGAATFDLSCMMMRGVCANRNIWGVEGKTSLTLRHSAKAHGKFAERAFPMLAGYAMSSPKGVIDKVKAAKSIIVAKTDDERQQFLMGKLGLSKGASDAVQLKCVQEEQKPLQSLWDAVQGVTAYARAIPHQDARIELELKAGKLMDKVSA